MELSANYKLPPIELLTEPTHKGLVTQSQLFQSREWTSSDAKIPLVLGSDACGKPFIYDLAQRPSLLITGLNKSGKSNCVHSILLSLLYRFTPVELRLILIDPNKFELLAYNGAPHLMVPVITDRYKAALAIDWVVEEMNARYRILAATDISDIEAYHGRKASKPTSNHESPDFTPLVVVIDEFSRFQRDHDDYLLTSFSEGDSAHTAIDRLSNKARAVGIYLIVADTYRIASKRHPLLVEENPPILGATFFPSRIVFGNTLKISKTFSIRMPIRDSSESHSKSTRSSDRTNYFYFTGQSAMVSDSDVMNVVSYISKHRPKTVKDNINDRFHPLPVGEFDEEFSVYDKKLICRCVDIMRETKQADPLTLRRLLKTHENTIFWILDLLERKGVIGAENATKQHDILVDLEHFDSTKIFEDNRSQSIILSQETSQGTNASDPEKPLERAALRQIAKTPSQEIIKKNKIWDNVVIDGETLKSITTSIKLFALDHPAAPRGLLLYGPPGTGKTMVARKIAESIECEFMGLSLPDLKGQHVGESGQNVRAIWNKARGFPRTVIFVDECEGVFGRRGGNESDLLNAELIQAFLSEWDGLKSNTVWVIGATNRRELLDEAIISRFGETVELGLPSAQFRRRIIQAEMSKLNVGLAVNEALEKNTQGLSGRDIAQLLKQAVRAAYPLPPEEFHLIEAARRMRRRAGTQVDEEASWGTLVLDDSVIRSLKTVCTTLQNAEAFKKQGVDIPKGILFHGPPGTGKTQIARTLANEGGFQFIGATIADLKAGWVGQSGQKVRELFQRARSSTPCILFLDEIDVVAPARGNERGEDPFTREILGQLLQEMDGIKASAGQVFVIAASNRPDSVDAALLSRFSKRILIPLPNQEFRHLLLKSFLSKKSIAFDLEEECKRIAAVTEGWSGRDLKNLIANAEEKAISRAIDAGRPDTLRLSINDFDLS